MLFKGPSRQFGHEIRSYQLVSMCFFNCDSSGSCSSHSWWNCDRRLRLWLPGRASWSSRCIQWISLGYLVMFGYFRCMHSTKIGEIYGIQVSILLKSSRKSFVCCTFFEILMALCWEIVGQCSSYKKKRQVCGFFIWCVGWTIGQFRWFWAPGRQGLDHVE